MYPNQQQPGQQQTPPPQPPSGFGPQPQGYGPTPGPQQQGQPQFQPQAQQQYQQAEQPQQPQGYGPQPTPTYAVDYLDQIAPPPAQPKFLSGFFGKAVIGLGVIFVLAVSLIVAFGNQKKTADIEQTAVRLGHMQTIAKANQKNLKDGDLLATNSRFQIRIANDAKDASTLLAQAGVAKKNYSKQMVAIEDTAATELSEKFLDAKLNAEFDRVYAREMAYQADLLLTMYKKMARTSQAKAIRDYAKNAATNLEPIQKSFAEFAGKST
jgi:hypothetical protein